MKKKFRLASTFSLTEFLTVVFIPRETRTNRKKQPRFFFPISPRRDSNSIPVALRRGALHPICVCRTELECIHCMQYIVDTLHFVPQFSFYVNRSNQERTRIKKEENIKILTCSNPMNGITQQVHQEQTDQNRILNAT